MRTKSVVLNDSSFSIQEIIYKYIYNYIHPVNRPFGMDPKVYLDLCKHAAQAFEDAQSLDLKQVTLAQFFRYRNDFYMAVEVFTHL